MFYDTRKKNDHGLPHDPFKAIVAPRPIGWITSMSAKGEINLAPYSWFNGVSSRPPMVMFSSEERKDSLAFVEETKEFVCNFASYDLREQVNRTSAPFPRGVNEMEKAGLAPAPSRLVKPPRVAASPCALECKWVQTVSIPARCSRSCAPAITIITARHRTCGFPCAGRREAAGFRQTGRHRNP
jgi:flavin reductase (DIM6/NTAB) family NADH-FMN oxidoreductase RutF